jgi:hypothetical protein
VICETFVQRPFTRRNVGRTTHVSGNRDPRISFCEGGLRQHPELFLSSVPPCAEDLEAHVKFAKIWGGGKEQKITLDICSYIKYCETNHIVTAAIFNTCSSLKIVPTELPTEVIAAVIKCIATRTPKNASTLIPSKLLKKTLDDKKAEVMEANMYMIKARQLCGANEELDKARGDFECDLIENLFGTSDVKDEPKQTMAELVGQFVLKIGGADPNVDDRAAGSSAKKPVTTASNVFNSTASDAVQQLLQSKGIKRGAIMQLRSDRENPFILETQFEISHTNENGSIGIRRINPNGSITEDAVAVAMDDILAKHVVVRQDNRMKELVPMHPNYDDSDNICRMVADIALYNLYKKNVVSNDLVIIQGAPKVRLIARSHIALQKLVLVPWSQGVQAKRIESKNDARVCVEVMTKPPTYFAVTAPLGLGKTIEVEFWRMTDDRKDVKQTNMKWSTLKEVVTWPIDTGRGKTVQVNITVAINTKVIQPNHEIRVYTASDKKRKIMEVSVDALTNDDDE